MAYYEGKTIAFSHKGGFWKTRYSYAPTCYGAVDNVMISTNKSLLWEHGINASHNNFYGDQFKSSVTVVSNEDPSAVKLFKALSIKSNSNDWVGDVKTNIKGNNLANKEYQLGAIKGFVTKEGNQYTELPRDLVNSSSHIDYVCQLNAIVMESSLIDTDGLGNNPAGTPQWRWWWNTKVATEPNTSILGGASSMAVFVNADGDAYTLQARNADGLNWQLNPFNGYDEGFERTVYIYSYVNKPPAGLYSSQGIINTEFAEVGTTQIILEQRGSATGAINSWGSHPNIHTDVLLFDKIADTIEANEGDWSTIHLYSASSPEINGDPMRGDFLHLTLTNNSAEPVETYAINVDFENTTLDSSSKGIAS